jgi:hypothetical protein
MKMVKIAIDDKETIIQVKDEDLDTLIKVIGAFRLR